MSKSGLSIYPTWWKLSNAVCLATGLLRVRLLVVLHAIALLLWQRMSLMGSVALLRRMQAVIILLCQICLMFLLC